MRSPLPVLTALLLCACQPRAPDGQPAPPPVPPPAEAPASRFEPMSPVSDFGAPITARGTEPFWAVTIDGTRLTLARPDRPEATFEAPGAAIQPGKAVWDAKAADGAAMRVTLYVSTCSDGMSDFSYPLTAEVELGAETLRGCAAKTAELRREGG
ncbi:COG3650 family protein [Phenylobacterium sp.]|uniref:COG3650 family protein n=1 Tax=Phenylobacterium sp. TaxID=1871053 RepID=UPI00391A97E1